MLTHRLAVYGQAALIGHFDSSKPWSQDETKDIAALFYEKDVYRLELEGTDYDWETGERMLA